MRGTSATIERAARGFTLIELLVVVAILTLLASMLPLALDRAMPSRRVAAVTHELAAALREAQSKSLSSGRAVTLRLSGGLLWDGARIAVAIPATTRVSLLGADGVALSAVSAFPEGTLTEARIQVRERSHVRTLRLSGLTGRITQEVAIRAQ